MTAGTVNGVDAQRVQNIRDRWLKVEEEFASEHGRLMQEIKEAKKDLLDEAEAAGVKKSLFRKSMAEMKLLAKADAIRDALSSQDDIDSYDNLRLALGMLEDLPLGQAALAAQEGSGAVKEPRKAKDKRASVHDEPVGSA